MRNIRVYKQTSYTPEGTRLGTVVGSDTRLLIIHFKI